MKIHDQSFLTIYKASLSLFKLCFILESGIRSKPQKGFEYYVTKVQAPITVAISAIGLKVD